MQSRRLPEDILRLFFDNIETRFEQTRLLYPVPHGYNQLLFQRMCKIAVNKIAETNPEDVPVAQVHLFLNGQVAFYLDLLPFYNLLRKALIN